MSTPLGYWADKAVWATKAFRFAFKYANGLKGRTAPKVPTLALENTNVCNSRCVFCPNGLMQRKRENLTPERFKKAIDEAIALGVTEIDFDVIIGDPLLDPNFLEYARYVSQFPQITEMGFITTLQWLHRFKLEDLFDCRFKWIHVSTALSGREKYCEFFGVDKYDQMLGNLVTLLNENNRRGNPILVDLSIKPTAEPIQDVLEHPDFKLICSLTSQNLAEAVRTQKFFVDDWFGAVDLPDYLRLRPLLPRAFRPCRYLYEGLVVYSNGKISVCPCGDFEANSELVVGHIDHDELGELWNGDDCKVKELRSDWKWKNKVPDICKNCRRYTY